MVVHCAQPTNEVKGAKGSITPTLQLAWATNGGAGHHGIRVTLPPKKKKKKEIKCLRSQQAYFTQLLILLW